MSDDATEAGDVVTGSKADDDQFDSTIWFHSFNELLGEVEAIAWELSNARTSLDVLIESLEIVEKGIAAWPSRRDDYDESVDLSDDFARAGELVAASDDVRTEDGELRRRLDDVLAALEPVEKAIRAWPTQRDADEEEQP